MDRGSRRNYGDRYKGKVSHSTGRREKSSESRHKHSSTRRARDSSKHREEDGSSQSSTCTRSKANRDKHSPGHKERNQESKNVTERELGHQKFRKDVEHQTVDHKQESREKVEAHFTDYVEELPSSPEPDELILKQSAVDQDNANVGFSKLEFELSIDKHQQQQSEIEIERKKEEEMLHHLRKSNRQHEAASNDLVEPKASTPSIKSEGECSSSPSPNHGSSTRSAIDNHHSFGKKDSGTDSVESSLLLSDLGTESDFVFENSPTNFEIMDSLKKKEEDHDNRDSEKETELPPYLPSVHGCRSVGEYKYLNRIAEGTYGIVYKAEDERTKEIVALKKLKMEREKNGFPITCLREINCLLQAQHENIVTVREIVVGHNMDHVFLVMDFIENDLKMLMDTMRLNRKFFLPGEVKCLMLQLLRGVAHIHNNWILHRDLKTSNLLLSNKGILKIGDFGLSRQYGSPIKAYTSLVVTLWYRAPELLVGCKKYSTPIDMWSVGCIFAELITMQPLFPAKAEWDLVVAIFRELGTPNEITWPGFNETPMVQAVKIIPQHPPKNLTRFAAKTSYFGIDLLKKFLTYYPPRRITAEDALQHSYFGESPLAIPPNMFEVLSANKELHIEKRNDLPTHENNGKDSKQPPEVEETSGFHMGNIDSTSQTHAGAGFHLKFN